MKTPTTTELFRKLAGLKPSKLGVLPGICSPICEVYLPKDNQGVRRMAFQWIGGGNIEFADYGNGKYWGGVPQGKDALK